jgi:glycerol uptake facilitator-like aquaporin
MMTKFNLSRRLVVECLGTAFLLATVVGSGIMGERLAGGNVAIALLGNTIATGAILVVLILIFGHISGAHFNPAVTISFLLQRAISVGEALLYIIVQIIGAFIGTMAAHVMFDVPLLIASTTVRTGMGQWTGEFIATFGSFYYSGILVHIIHVLCQSGCYLGTLLDQYVFRHCAAGCFCVHSRSIIRGGGGYAFVCLAFKARGGL